MEIPSFPFQTVDWATVPKKEHKGETGVAHWQTMMMGEIRVRLVEYSPGYKADHWCKKGHIIHCLEGEMETELNDGQFFVLRKGMSYFVGDSNGSHRSFSVLGCRLFIVD